MARGRKRVGARKRYADRSSASVAGTQETKQKTPGKISGPRLSKSGEPARASDKASLGIAVCGLVVYSTGLFNGFLGDDFTQIVNATPVHSISNFFQFFQGSTFWNGGSFTGAYYRPLQTVVYSLIYTIFGATPFVFHFVQLGFLVGGTILLYLVLRNWVRKPVALVLALLFLVHPIDSEAAFFIPAMADVLFFFFGILALWLVIRSDSVRSLVLAAGCLFLSLLSKESGVLFVGVVGLYLLMFNRRRILPFVGAMAVPLVVWVLLRANAVGFIPPALNQAPIDLLGLGGRLMTVPSILLHYFGTLLWPVSLASGYYFVHPTFSFADFVFPLLVDLAICAVALYVGRAVRRRGTPIQFRTYIFFATWIVAGLALYMQILPLDLTAADQWFYFPMAGLLGLVGVSVSALVLPSVPINRRRVIATGVVVILVLCGVRTALRGLDFGNAYSLAALDASVDPTNYTALVKIAAQYESNGDLANARTYAQRAVDVLAYPPSDEQLGDVCYKLADYECALKAYLDGARYGDIQAFIDNVARTMLFAGDYQANKNFLEQAVVGHPGDVLLWDVLAVQQYRNGDSAGAVTSVKQAYALSHDGFTTDLYQKIANNQPLGHITP